MASITYSAYKNLTALARAFTLASLPIDYLTGTRNANEETVTAHWTRALTPSEIGTAQTVFDAVNATDWTLVADGNAGESDITITGADAACDWLVTIEGEAVVSETDNSSPYALTLVAPVAAGAYAVQALAVDGTRCGTLNLEVV